MTTLSEVFTQDTIQYYKTHKDEITSELLTQLRSFGNEGKQVALDILDTEKSKDGYYLDAYGNRITFNGDRELKSPFTSMKLHPVHLEELKKCKESLEYFRENYVKIRTKDGIDFPELRDYQNGFLKAIQSDFESIVSMQPRQAGKSITVSIYLVWYFNFDHDKNIGICANKLSLAKEFLNNVKNIFYSLPMWMRVGVNGWNKTDISSENEMRVLTSSPAGAFRGFTIDLLVVDEVAFIKKTVYNGFIDAVTPSQSARAWKKNIFISTANGLNHFYEMVEGAKARKEYKFIEKEELDRIKLKYKILECEHNTDGTYNVKVDYPSNDMLFYEVKDYEVPRYNKKGKRLTNEEFKESVIDKFGLVYYNQNYGNQFIGSSYTLIDESAIKRMNPCDAESVWDSRLQVFVEPESNHRYIMGVDPAKSGIDAFAVQIIDVTSFPFVQVASAQLFKCNYQVMPEFIYEWASKYNYAYLIVENNEGAGTFIANMLNLDFEYPNMYKQKVFAKYNMVTTGVKVSKEPGFRTTSKNRNQILETFKNFIDNNRLIIKDIKTINEIMTFIIKDGKYQADDGCHDDMIMSLALCFVPFIDSRNFDDMSKLIKMLYSDTSMVNIDLTDYMIIGDFDAMDDDSTESLAGKKYDSEFEYSTDYYSKFF